jgi:hypothetical protein
MATNKTKLTGAQQKALLQMLEGRFAKNRQRHSGIAWEEVKARLEANASACWSLQQMEDTGGEPDVVDCEKETGKFIFMDCAAESPAGRRSLCYDDAALDARKENKPAGSAMGMAAEMGITLLDEAQYRHLQTLGDFDTKTSSWLLTPLPIRQLGGSIFGDRRYNQVFIYHNGAQSYYAARGFRGMLRL